MRIIVGRSKLCLPPGRLRSKRGNANTTTMQHPRAYNHSNVIQMQRTSKTGLTEVPFLFFFGSLGRDDDCQDQDEQQADHIHFTVGRKR